MKNTEFRILDAGDCSIIVEFGNEISDAVNARVSGFAAALASASASGALSGVVEWVPTFRSVSVYYSPLAVAHGKLVERLSELAQNVSHTVPDRERKTVHRIPVCYEGEYAPDMHTVATHAGLTPAQVIAAHSGRDYRIYMLGFLPGFVYLGGMEPRLETPRLPVPRLKIPAGSVAIGGAQTGIYPLDSPGGWQIIGKTPIRPYDPGRDPQILFRAGDYIRFVPVSSGEFRNLAEESRTVQTGRRSAGTLSPRAVSSGIQVVSGGLLTTVQDAGRYGCQKDGFCVSGVMDAVSFRIANAIAGNSPGAAVLETTLAGPELKFTLPARFVITGADCGPTLDGVRIPLYTGIDAREGSVLSMGQAVQGLRSYIAFSGGLLVPRIMGSSSTTLKYGLGGIAGRKLESGDEIPIGLPETRAAAVSVPAGLKTAGLLPGEGAALTVRVVPGPQDDYFTGTGKQTFTGTEYTLDGKSDRMGFRFNGEKIESRRGTDIISDGIAPGSVQIPPAGTPIIMMADRQTTGGYAKIGTVISADLPVLAQAVPGMKIRFRFVTCGEAVSALEALEQKLHILEGGGCD